MLRNIKTVSLLFFIIYCFSYAFANDNKQSSMYVASVGKLVKMVDDELNNNILEHFEMTQVLYEFKHDSVSFWPLVDVTTNSWMQVVKNWDGIVSNDDERIILLHALLFLPPNEYIEFLHHALALYSAKKISRYELHVLVICPPNNKRWLLSYNYKDPAVINFLTSFENTVAGDKDFERLIKFIRSGKAKKRDQFLRKNKTEKYYEMNPIPTLNTQVEESWNSEISDDVKSTEHVNFYSYILLGVGVLIFGGICFLFWKKR